MIDIDVTLARNGFALAVNFNTDSRALALFGESGAGKSTVLMLMAGLLRPDSGRIVIDGQVFVDTERGIWREPRRRRVGLVFQDAMLFPHLSVQANLDYGRPRPHDRRIDARALIELLGIGALLDRRPVALSGGERQRVAIGRALLAEPALLLLDEPLASLDAARRAEIMPYLARLRERFDVPLVYVSHAIEEVVRLVDDVVCLERGKVTDMRAIDDFVLVRGHADPGAAARADSAFGDVSVVRAEVVAYDPRYQMTELAHPAGRIGLPGRVGEPGQPYRMLVRATDVALAVSRPRDTSHRTVLEARIAGMTRTEGPLLRVMLELRGQGRLMALITRQAADAMAIDTGDRVYALAKATAIDDRAFAMAPGGRRGAG